MRAVLTAILASLALVACDGGGDPVQQALRETAAANQSATVRETATTSASDSVTAASGETADQAYIAGMIEHHRGAVVMAEAALKESRDPEVRRMAQAVVDSRTGEIAEMQAWKSALAN